MTKLSTYLLALLIALSPTLILAHPYDSLSDEERASRCQTYMAERQAAQEAIGEAERIRDEGGPDNVESVREDSQTRMQKAGNELRLLNCPGYGG